MKDKIFRTVYMIASILIIFSSNVFAQSGSITITIDMNNSGLKIPKNFSGFSFGRGTLSKANDGYLFDSTNTQLITLFRELGIKNLRIGGTSVDEQPTPSHQVIDALFRFADAAGIKIIYSFRLANGDPLEDASAAKYIWNNYKQYLDCFSIGNEPNYIEGFEDPEVTDYSTYLVKWRKFASSILDSVPQAQFGGPDATTTTRGISWGPYFARDEENSGTVKSIFYHYYVGGSSDGKDAQQLIDAMLSQSWITSNYRDRFDTTAVPALRYGFPYRFTEANSYFGVGEEGGSNSFATALFSLDFMYWWASHGCMGVNFHCTMSRLNSTIYKDNADNYLIRPMGYGIKAFNEGRHGSIYPLTINNTQGLNLTAYAAGSEDSLFVTIVNKEHDTSARDAEVKIIAARLPNNAAAMYLTSTSGDAAAVSGIKLGGGAIENHGSFLGRWTLLDKVSENFTIDVPAMSAVIVLFTKNIFGTPPETPVSVLPKGGITNVSRTPILKWNSSNMSTEYRLQFTEDRNFHSVIFDTTLTDTSLNLSFQLKAETKYFWRVAGLNNEFLSEFSTADSFMTIFAQPATPNLISPAAYANGVSCSPIFKWNSSLHAEKYKLQISTDYHIYVSNDSLGAFISANVVFDTTLTDTVLKISSSLSPLTRYYWHIAASNESGTSWYSNSPLFFFTTENTVSVNESNSIPVEFALYQNYPNPFNPSTIIRYDIPQTTRVTINIYDILGRSITRLIDAVQAPGEYKIEFDGSKLSSGIYFINMKSYGKTFNRKIILVK